MKLLTLKQQRFADEYIISGNATQAAKKAGYSEKTAYRTGADNLRHPQIKAYIGERLKSLEKETVARLDEVLEFTTAMMRGKVNTHVVAVEKEEDGTSRARVIEKPADSKERLKAAEMMGKRYRAWMEDPEISEMGDITISIDYGPEEPPLAIQPIPDFLEEKLDLIPILEETITEDITEAQEEDYNGNLI